MKEVKESIPNELLRQARFQQGWSQVDVANKVGSDPKTVGRWERGVTTPSPYFCQKLCQLYEKTPQELGLFKENDGAEPINTQEQAQELSASASIPTIEHPPSQHRLPLWRQTLKRHRWLIVSQAALILLLIAVAFIRFFPQPTASASLALNDPYTGAGALAMNDALSSNLADWSLNQNAQGNCRFQNGGYVVRGIMANYMEVCLDGNSFFSNFAYEVSMKITAGDCGGLAFRTNFPLLYYFIICQDGHYRLVRYDRDHIGLRRVIASGISPIIHTGYSHSNTIATVADGTTLNLYINQHLLGHFTDSAYATGQIGLMVHTCRVVYADSRPNLCTAPTQVIFQNAKVWKL